MICHDVVMPLFVRSQEAARRLGVSRATLYAYVSRGLIGRRTAIDGRTSLYSADDVDALATRSRGSRSSERPSVDVQITSAITQLDEDGLLYRGRDVAELARTETFPRVAELLWTGVLPADGQPDGQDWPAPADADLAACRAAVTALGASASPLHELLAITNVFGARHGDDEPVVAARRLLSAIPVLDGRRRRGGYADRLARCWHSRPGPELRRAIDRALVLLADHELATSTLAARVAASVRTDSYAALSAGLATVSGRLHGSAASAAHALLVEADRVGPAGAVAAYIAERRRLPGFGHTVYRDVDPRFAPLLEAVHTLPDPRGRLEVVDDVRRHAGTRIAHQPNVDFGLAALAFVGGLRPDVPIFAVARIAGWAAHIEEELSERPVRFRGLANPRLR